MRRQLLAAGVARVAAVGGHILVPFECYVLFIDKFVTLICMFHVIVHDLHR